MYTVYQTHAYSTLCFFQLQKTPPPKKTFVGGGGNTPNTNLSFVGWDEYLESTREIDLDVSGWLLVGDNLFLAKTMGVECC